MRLLRVLFAFIAFLINYPIFSQTDHGKVIIKGKPESAIITLNDSIIQGGKYYVFPQGIYNLNIQAEGFKTYNSEFFQVFKDKTNSFEYKLKENKERSVFRATDLVIPAFSIPLSIVLSESLFPISSLDEAQSNIDLKKSFLLSAVDDLETPEWKGDLQRKTNNYNEALKEYETSIEDYNEQVRINNRNRVIKFSIVSSVVIINSVYLYQKIKKRKVEAEKLSLNINQNSISLSKRF